MNETTALVRSPETIGAEIRNLTHAMRYMTLWYGVEIGRRLQEAKEQVAHGEWMDFLMRETEFSSSSASRFMTLFREYGDKDISNFPTLGNISVSNALRLLAAPEETQDEVIEMAKNPEISAEELNAAIKERDEARKAQQAAEKAAEEAQKRIDEADQIQAKLRNDIKILQNRPVEVAVERDEAAITEAAEKAKAAAEANYTKELDKLKKERAAAEKQLQEKLSAAEAKLKDAEANAGNRAQAEAEIADLKKQIEMANPAIVEFKVHFKAWQDEHYKLMQALQQVPDEHKDKLIAAVKKQIESW